MNVRNFLAVILLGIGMMLMGTGAARAGSYVDDVKLATQDPNVILTVYMGMSAQDLETNFAGAKDWKLVKKQQNYRGIDGTKELMPFMTYVFNKGNIGKDTVCERLQVDVEDVAGVTLASISFFTNYRSAAADIKERIYTTLASYHGESNWHYGQFDSGVTWNLTNKNLTIYTLDRNKFKEVMKGRMGDDRDKSNPALYYVYWVQYAMWDRR